jgi:hypothetical protein
MKNLEEYDTRKELVMNYCPILGVSYELKNVVTKKNNIEWDEDHALNLVLNGIIEDLEKDGEMIIDRDI